jgi:hypothetical protein
MCRLYRQVVPVGCAERERRTMLSHESPLLTDEQRQSW